MAVGIRIARVGFLAVSSVTNQVIDKNSATVAELLRTHHEHRVLPDPGLPSSVGQPTVHGYLLAEAADGYRLLYLDENTVITTDNPGPYLMPLDIHIARSRFVAVDRAGNVIDKNHRDTTIAQVAQSEHQHRVEEDPLVPNTSGQPSIDEYLKLEAAQDYMLAHLDQRYIITYLV